MNTVTHSSKYQIVVPQALRQPMGLKPGDKLGMLRIGNMIQVMPIPTLEAVQALCQGCGTEIINDPERFADGQF